MKRKAWKSSPDNYLPMFILSCNFNYLFPFASDSFCFPQITLKPLLPFRFQVLHHLSPEYVHVRLSLCYSVLSSVMWPEVLAMSIAHSWVVKGHSNSGIRQWRGPCGVFTSTHGGFWNTFELFQRITLNSCVSLNLGTGFTIEHLTLCFNSSVPHEQGQFFTFCWKLLLKLRGSHLTTS